MIPYREDDPDDKLETAILEAHAAWEAEQNANPPKYVPSFAVLYSDTFHQFMTQEKAEALYHSRTFLFPGEPVLLYKSVDEYYPPYSQTDYLDFDVEALMAWRGDAENGNYPDRLLNKIGRQGRGSMVDSWEIEE